MGLPVPRHLCVSSRRCLAQVGGQVAEGAAHPWQVLDRKTAADFFNGIACARFDPEAGKLYVSIGFQGTHTIELALSGFSRATFEAVARYYDGRKAAYTLSNDNWGCNAWAHPAPPGREPPTTSRTITRPLCTSAEVFICRFPWPSTAVRMAARPRGRTCNRSWTWETAAGNPRSMAVRTPRIGPPTSSTAMARKSSGAGTTSSSTCGTFPMAPISTNTFSPMDTWTRPSRPPAR